MQEFENIKYTFKQNLKLLRPMVNNLQTGSEKSIWSVKLPFEGKIFEKMRFEELILKDISD